MSASRFIRSCIITIAVGALAACTTASWSTVSAPDLGFSVDMLGPAQRTEGDTLNDKNVLNAAMVDIKQSTYRSDSGGAALEARVMNFNLKTGGNMYALDYSAIENNLWSVVFNEMDQEQAAKVAERTAELDGKSVKEVEYAGESRMHTFRILRTGNRYYLLHVAHSKSGDHTNDRARFFNSFRLIEA